MVPTEEYLPLLSAEAPLALFLEDLAVVDWVSAFLPPAPADSSFLTETGGTRFRSGSSTVASCLSDVAPRFRRFEFDLFRKTKG